MGLKKLSRFFQFFSAVFLFLPFFAEAASVKEIFRVGTNYVLQIIQILWLVAIAAFFYGVIKFILSSGNPQKKSAAKNLIIYGLVGLFVLFSFWGLIRILRTSVFVGDGMVDDSFYFFYDPSYYEFRYEEGQSDYFNVDENIDK